MKHPNMMPRQYFSINLLRTLQLEKMRHAGTPLRSVPKCAKMFHPLGYLLRCLTAFCPAQSAFFQSPLLSVPFPSNAGRKECV